MAVKTLTAIIVSENGNLRGAPAFALFTRGRTGGPVPDPPIAHPQTTHGVAGTFGKVVLENFASPQGWAHRNIPTDSGPHASIGTATPLDF